jgi:hypothetical protein
MTVKQLREKLAEFPDDMSVWVDFGHSGAWEIEKVTPLADGTLLLEWDK